MHEVVGGGVLEGSIMESSIAIADVRIDTRIVPRSRVSRKSEWRLESNAVDVQMRRKVG